MSTTPKINTVDIGNGSQELSDAVAAGIETFSRLAALKEADEEKAERERETGEKGKIGNITALINLIDNSMRVTDIEHATEEDLVHITDNIALLKKLAGELPSDSEDSEVYRAAAAVTQNTGTDFVARTATTIRTRDAQQVEEEDLLARIVKLGEGKLKLGESELIDSKKLWGLADEVSAMNKSVLTKRAGGLRLKVVNALNKVNDKLQFQDFVTALDDDKETGYQLSEADALNPYLVALFKETLGYYTADEENTSYSAASKALITFAQANVEAIITRLERQINSKNSSENAEAAVVLAKVTGVHSTVSEQWDQQKAKAEEILSTGTHSLDDQRIAYEIITNDKAMEYKASFLNKAKETIKADDYDISKEITRLTQKQRDYLNDANDKIQAELDEKSERKQNAITQTAESTANRIVFNLQAANNVLDTASGIPVTENLSKKLFNSETGEFDKDLAKDYATKVADRIQRVAYLFGDVDWWWGSGLEGKLDDLNEESVEIFRKAKGIKTTGGARRRLFSQIAKKWMDDDGNFYPSLGIPSSLDVTITDKESNKKLGLFRSLMHSLRLLSDTGYEDDGKTALEMVVPQAKEEE